MFPGMLRQVVDMRVRSPILFLFQQHLRQHQPCVNIVGLLCKYLIEQRDSLLIVQQLKVGRCESFRIRDFARLLIALFEQRGGILVILLVEIEDTEVGRLKKKIWTESKVQMSTSSAQTVTTLPKNKKSHGTYANHYHCIYYCIFDHTLDCFDFVFR